MFTLQVTFVSVGLCAVSYLAFLWWVVAAVMMECDPNLTGFTDFAAAFRRYCWYKKLMFQ